MTMPKRSAVNPNVANGANRVSHVLGSRPRGHRLLSRAQQSIAVLLLMLTGLQAHAADSELEAIQDSLIKIYTTQAAPDYFSVYYDRSAAIARVYCGVYLTCK